jgi:hypothetical protein
MPAPRAFNQTARKRARELYDTGHGCNAIAKQLGYSPATISKWAKDTGIRFDRSQTDLATRAHTIDLRADALLLAQKAMVAAHDAVDRLDGQYTLRELGRAEGKDAGDEWHELTIDEAPIDVVRNAMVVAGIAIDKALKVSAALDEGEDLPAVDAWLNHMVGDDEKAA